ncbi:MAG: DUF4124 domain-containing protein, partial [Candidatus Competibacteraceae bacterium]|nr:DUF4124 domain-containing protein [Candidatus Competibacteraceae bacterium]
GNIILSNPAGRQQPELDLESAQPIGPEQAGPADPAPDQYDPDEVETGERVYSWTDDQGVVHYSDQPRSQEAQPVDLSDQPFSAVEDTDVRETEEALIEELDDDRVERQIEEF